MSRLDGLFGSNFGCYLSRKSGPEGLEGGMSAKKYASITGASKATATRDLGGLLRAGALKQLPGGGRSTRYEIALGDLASSS